MFDRSPTDDALAIWNAGVDAVRPERLIPRVLTCDESQLTVAGQSIGRDDCRRIVVVGAGKAGGSMAAAVEDVISLPAWREKLTGWVNVPADCVRPLERIHLHAARPAGVNEPTEEGVRGTREILALARSCTPDDLLLVLLSGGGSALLPAPAEGLTLAEKQEITRKLSLGGATINELNCVRKHLSDVKGGRLARAGRSAGWLISLIVSDVVGDPLDVIASGPTVPDSTRPEDALAILNRIYGSPESVPAGAKRVLQRRASEAGQGEFPGHVENDIIGSNAAALAAAAQKAAQLGYAVESLGSNNEGTADDQGVQLAEHALRLRNERSSPVCLLSGGEPTVTLVSTDRSRKGGRNQQLALSALCRLRHEDLSNIVILSGGTDGEDGPTDAAGAFVDARILQAMQDQNLDPESYRNIQNAYPFFEKTAGLLHTGPTGTNVMDLRVVIVGE